MNLLVDLLACYRLTRLATTDRVLDAPRGVLSARNETTAYFLACPWCVGLWAAVGVVAARQVAPRAWEPLARALALSAVVGLYEEWAA